MTKWLDLFSIRQKLAILLFFTLSAVSYIAISSIKNSDQQQQHNMIISIAQQQQLLVERFINAFFLARMHANVAGNNPNTSELKKNQFIFERNSKALLAGGRAYLDLTMKNSLQITSITDETIKAEIKESQLLWTELQLFSENLPLKRIRFEQIDVLHHLSYKLQEKLIKTVNSLTLLRDQQAQKQLLALQLSWLIILLMSALITWFITQNIIQPLDNLAKVSSRIRFGNLQSYPMNNQHRDELATVAYQSDQMRIVLSDLMLKIQLNNKQIVYSSEQINQLSNEMHQDQALQYEQYQNIQKQFIALQQNNNSQIELLLLQLNCHQENNQTTAQYCQALMLNVNNLEKVQNSARLSTTHLQGAQKIALKLNDMLKNIENITSATTKLAQPIALDAVNSGEKFTVITAQTKPGPTSSLSTIAEISPLLKQLQSEISAATMALDEIQKQTNPRQESSQAITFIEELSKDLNKHQQVATTLVDHNKQHNIQLEQLYKALDGPLSLIKESERKTETNKLFAQDLSKISLQLDALSQEFKIDEKEYKIRKSNEKRSFPRINNHIKVSLQQADIMVEGLTQDLSLSGLQLKSVHSVEFNHSSPVTFVISLPGDEGGNKEQCITLLGDVVRYDQQQDTFFYGARFHPLCEQDKIRMQEIFDYFYKKSEFKVG